MRKHCDAVGRDPAEIEITVTLRLPEATDDSDEVVRHAEAMASIGVDTVMARPIGPDPVAFLEKVWGPAVPKLAAVVPTKA